MKKLNLHPVEIVVFLGIVGLLAAGTYARNGVWNDEVDLWTDVVKKSPGKARAHSNLGFAYLEAGRYDRALQESQRAIEIDPKFAMAYFVNHLVNEKTGNSKQAIEMAKKALDLDPTLSIATLSLGRIYFGKGEYEASAEWFGRFVSIYPYFPEVHHLMGVAYTAQKQFDKAVREFEWEIRINPSHALAHLNLGQISWFEFQDRGKALRHLKAAISLDPFLPNRAQIQKFVRSLEASP